jgi:hypothetical protein
MSEQPLVYTPQTRLRLVGQTCPDWGLDMSGFTFKNPKQELDKFSWDLTAKELGLGRTCPVKVIGTRPGTRIHPINPGETERPGHVRAGGQKCSVRVSGIRLET